MLHGAISEKVIGCAYTVYNTLGFGFLESVYENCLRMELEGQGIQVQVQVPVPVFYKSVNVGDFYADMLVDDSVIVELKSVRQLSLAHEVQLVNYLAATGKQVGLLINFGGRGVEIKRKTKDIPDKAL